MNTYLSNIGYHGPNTLIGLILIALTTTSQHTNVYLYIYVIVWQIVSHLINIIIKNTLKHPRPDSYKNEEFHTLSPCIENYFQIHKNFGMPSGHAQSVISETTFIALYFRNPYILLASGIQTAITLYQRYTTQRHSIKQLATGSIIGVIVGFVFYKIVLKYIEI